MRESGHVVLVSGFTLIASFCGFFISECEFLIQPAVANAIGIAICLLINLSVAPAALLAFPAFFTDYNLLPQWCYKLCCPHRRSPMLGDTDATGDEIEVEEPAIADRLAAEVGTEAQSGLPANLRRATHDQFASPRSTRAINKRADPGAAAGALDFHSREEEEEALYGAAAGSGGPEDEANVRLRKMRRSCWFKVGSFLVRFPNNLIVLLLVFGLLGGVAWKLWDLKLLSNFELGVSPRAPSVKVRRGSRPLQPPRARPVMNSCTVLVSRCVCPDASPVPHSNRWTCL